MGGINGIFGQGNVNGKNFTLHKVEAAKPGAIPMVSSTKVDNNNYLGVKFTQTPGNTGVNEGTARGVLKILDSMDSFVIAP